MKKGITYFVLGTVLSFLFNYIFYKTENICLDIYYSVAFGFAWFTAYYLDNPSFKLLKKLGLSFLALLALVGVGFMMFNFEYAISSVIKFSTVFVAYYLIASLRSSKSLRN